MERPFIFENMPCNSVQISEIDILHSGLTRMKKIDLGYRAWYYFRNGWSIYFAFVFGAVNTLVVTYYLAIERVPILKEIFPSFVYYVAIAVALGKIGRAHV